MASKSLQIRDAIIAMLSAPVMPGIGSGGVSVDPDYAFNPTDLPVVAVYRKDERELQNFICATHLDYEMPVFVRVLSRGSDAFASGDALVAEGRKRVMADRSIGGLAIATRYDGIHRERDVLDAPVASAELSFTVHYRSAINSLEG